MIYTTTPPSSNFYSNQHKIFSTSSSPIKGNTRSNGGTAPLSSFFKDFNKQQQQQQNHHQHHHHQHQQQQQQQPSSTATPGLPSPVLSPSNCSSTSSQHLSVADPLAMVTQHPSPVTTTTTTAAKVATPGNRLTSPYYSSNTLTVQRTQSSANSVDECLTSPSSPLVMTANNSPNNKLRSPVSFCIETTSAVAYIDMVSQHQQHQNASPGNRSLSSSSSQHDICSPQPSTTSTEYQGKYSQMISNNPTTASSFIHQSTTDERYDYAL